MLRYPPHSARIASPSPSVSVEEERVVVFSEVCVRACVRACVLGGAGRCAYGGCGCAGVRDTTHLVAVPRHLLEGCISSVFVCLFSSESDCTTTAAVVRHNAPLHLPLLFSHELFGAFYSHAVFLHTGLY